METTKPIHSDDIKIPLNQPFGYRTIRSAQSEYEQTKSYMNKIWEEECVMYKDFQTIIVKKHNKKMTKMVPKRNYVNATGCIQDSCMFPYHSAFYPLLDAYDCLYEDENDEPVDDDSYRPFPKYPIGDWPDSDDEGGCDHFLEFREYVETGWTRSSIIAVDVSLMQEDINQVEDHRCRESFPEALVNYSMNLVDEFFSIDDCVKHCRACATPVVDKIMNEVPTSYKNNRILVSDVRRRHGLSQIPSSRVDRSNVLLKLLCHSMSELQRDYKISGAVLLCLLRFGDINDVTVLRRVLAVLDSEYIPCGFSCDKNLLARSCHDCINHVMNSFRSVLVFGFNVFQAEHGTCLVGFVHSLYLRDFGHLMASSNSKGTASTRSNLKLKREVAAGASAEAVETPNRIPTSLVLLIIKALGCRSRLELMRLQALLDASDNKNITTEVYYTYWESYQNCVRTLTSITELTFKILPSGERFHPIGSACVQAFYYALATVCATGREHRMYRRFMEFQPSLLRSDYLSPPKGHERLCTPLRYSDRVENATEYFGTLPAYKLRNDSEHESENPRDKLLRYIDVMIRGRPPANIRVLVRALFARDLVNVRQAGLGYGDFLLWCRYDITLEDSLLFRHDCHFPKDEPNYSVNWDKDENFNDLSLRQIRYRYNFTLLSLARAWSAPWSPNSHLSYQPAMRDAIKTVALCTRRRGMPVDVMHRITSFLHRDWWTDDNVECWNPDCQIATLSKAIDAYSNTLLSNQTDNTKQLADFLSERTTSSLSLKPCRKCDVAKYCSKTCKDSSFKSSHKRCCNRPPCCKGRPTPDEIKLYHNLYASSASTNSNSSMDTVLIQNSLPLFIQNATHKNEEEKDSTQRTTNIAGHGEYEDVCMAKRRACTLDYGDYSDDESVQSRSNPTALIEDFFISIDRELYPKRAR